jgi:hypothetical protein
MKILVLDIEASGLHDSSYPIEIAYGDLDTSEINSHLITPTAKWKQSYWDPTAEKMHGISLQSLDKATPALDVAKIVQHDLGNADIILSDAPDWDQIWIDKLWAEGGLENPPILRDFFSLINVISPESGPEILEHELKDPAHRAGDDVKMLVELFRKCLGME